MKKILSTSDNNISIALCEFEIVNKFDDGVELVIFNENIFGETFDLVRTKGVKYCGGERLSKLHEYFLLNRFNIKTPKVYYNIHTNKTIQSVDELNAFVDLEEFVVKPPFGAQGVGVKKINRAQWKTCYFDNKQVYYIFKDEFVKKDDVANIIDSDLSNIECVNKQIPTNYIESNFSEFIIQEPIDVKREFRLIYFSGGKYLVYERIKSENQFRGNLANGSTPKIIEIGSDDDINLIKPMLPSIKRIIDELNYPWLSVDLYEDINGNIGIFEFQMEFGYEGFDYKDVKREMIGCLNYLIEK